MSAAALILASQSRYRAELLDRLRLPFLTDAADIDETPGFGEPPAALAERLAEHKARHVARRHPGAWVIGSDQVAACADKLLGKPGTLASARSQLAQLSGRQARFHTAVCLISPAGDARQALDTTAVRMRHLDSNQIERYLALEPALDCAGSFKCEGYGITLFESIDASDPTALIGLPLIALSRLLSEAGWPLP